MSTCCHPLVIPVIHAGIAVVTVDEGGTAVLDCNATGNPTPTVSWFHSSLSVPVPGDMRIRQANNDSLIMTNVGVDDEGLYVCEATNIAGSETATLELVVNGKWTVEGQALTHETQLTLCLSVPKTGHWNAEMLKVSIFLEIWDRRYMLC